jgi:transcription antitermination factor NusG
MGGKLMELENLQAGEGQDVAWYAIYAKHQHEKSAADLLSRKGFQILLPLYRSIRRWNDRNKAILLPLFPSYLFVRTDLSRKLEILRTPGVFWLVESGGCASPIPDGQIEAIHKIIQSPDQVAPHPYLKAGERVRIRHGSFEGVQGILTRFKNQYRIVVAIEQLQRAVAIEIDLASVEPMPVQRPGDGPFFLSDAAGGSEG